MERVIELTGLRTESRTKEKTSTSAKIMEGSLWDSESARTKKTPRKLLEFRLRILRCSRSQRMRRIAVKRLAKSVNELDENKREHVDALKYVAVLSGDREAREAAVKKLEYNLGALMYISGYSIYEDTAMAAARELAYNPVAMILVAQNSRFELVMEYVIHMISNDVLSLMHCANEVNRSYVADILFIKRNLIDDDEAWGIVAAHSRHREVRMYGLYKIPDVETIAYVAENSEYFDVVMEAAREIKDGDDDEALKFVAAQNKNKDIRMAAFKQIEEKSAWLSIAKSSKYTDTGAAALERLNGDTEAMIRIAMSSVNPRTAMAAIKSLIKSLADDSNTLRLIAEFSRYGEVRRFCQKMLEPDPKSEVF